MLMIHMFLWVIALISEVYSLLWHLGSWVPTLATRHPWQALTVTVVMRGLLILSGWQVWTLSMKLPFASVPALRKRARTKSMSDV